MDERPKGVIATTAQPNTTTRQPGTPLLYTIKEAAHVLRISRTKLYELLDAGEVESIHIGRSRKIPAAAIYAYIDHLRDEERK